MDKRISYLLKCEKCGNLEEFIARDTNINSILTDQDIFNMIVEHLDAPRTISYCFECRMSTLQTRVAWIGVTDEEKSDINNKISESTINKFIEYLSEIHPDHPHFFVDEKLPVEQWEQKDFPHQWIKVDEKDDVVLYKDFSYSYLLLTVNNTIEDHGQNFVKSKNYKYFGLDTCYTTTEPMIYKH